jgi:hypothetical protein
VLQTQCGVNIITTHSLYSSAGIHVRCKKTTWLIKIKISDQVSLLDSGVNMGELENVTWKRILFLKIVKSLNNRVLRVRKTGFVFVTVTDRLGTFRSFPVSVFLFPFWPSSWSFPEILVHEYRHHIQVHTLFTSQPPSRPSPWHWCIIVYLTPYLTITFPEIHCKRDYTADWGKHDPNFTEDRHYSTPGDN